jgi:glycosyltransferase involved in cell wall biosynthesis
MRIAITYWTRRKIGGTEAYLESVIPELVNAGHEVAFWHEVDEPASNDQIALPPGMPTWCVSDLGPRYALAALREWCPDVIYNHSLMDPKLEAEILRVAPTVFFAHAYYGTCISGDKTFKTSSPTPCHRRFGWQCMLHYYPHHCGGWSPVTMVKEYQRQSRRWQLLSHYQAIVTHSSYMQAEYINHGFDPRRVHCLSYYAHEVDPPLDLNVEGEAFDNLPVPPFGTVAENTEPAVAPPACWRLLFLGRMNFLKGGRVLIDALPLVCAALDRPVRVIFAGDGPDRKSWERHAERTQARCEGLEIEFVGWAKGSKREALWNDCDLLVFSSVWPEPFGLVGPEAGLRGVPTVAFAVGGITDWLKNGVNGYLASGDHPSSEGLAHAIVKCFRTPKTYARLRRGAVEVAQQFKMQRHLAALLSVLEQVAQDGWSEERRADERDSLQSVSVLGGSV